MQNPSDGDATYRKKRNKSHRGYVVNASESCDEDNKFQLITDVQVEKNNVSDDKLLEKSLDDENSLVSEADDLYTDGGFSGEKVERKCRDKDINLHISGIKGRKRKDDSKIGLDEWQITEDQVICPSGKRAVYVKYNEKNKRYCIRMNKSDCADCKLRDKCLVQERKKFYSLGFYRRELEVSLRRKRLKDADYREKINVRAGAEGMIYQIFYKIGKQSKYRGLLRVRNAILIRSIAVNFQRMVKYVSNSGVKGLFFSFLYKFVEKISQFLQINGYRTETIADTN
jgi:hypothetical protein